MAKKSPLYAGDPALVALGEAVRQARRSAGLSQEALALATGLDRSYVGGLERGEHNLSLMSLVRIAAVLKVKASELLASAGQ